MKSTQPDSIRVLLKWHFERKTAKNASYSLRAFARDLGIPASNLSAVLNQKRRGFSQSNIQKICTALNLSEIEKKNFLKSNEAEAASFIKEIKSSDFEVFSKPKYLKILSFTHLVPRFHPTLENAQRIGLSLIDLKKSVNNLVKHGALKNHSKFFESTGNFFVNPKETKNLAVQDFHHEILSQAQHAIIHQSVEDREFNALIFPTDEASLEKMKTRIREFRSSFEKEFGRYEKSSKPCANSIHALAIQLFRIDQKPTAPKTQEKPWINPLLY